MRFRQVLAGATAGWLVAAAAPTAGATADATPNRLAGVDRFHTARVIAEQTFPAGANTVVLVDGRSFADALAAAYLGGTSQAPVLLTEAGGLPAGVTDTMRALGADGVQVIGGTASVSEAVVDQLEREGFVVSRLAGEDRYETARKAAEILPGEAVGELAEGRTAIVATGESFADALAAGPVSAGHGLPILFTPSERLHDDARLALENLGIEQALIVGGTAAVSEAVADEIAAMGLGVRRVAGADRAATAVALGELAADEIGFAMARVLLARGDVFADALAGGVRGGELGAPIVLTAADGSLGAGTRDFIAAHADTVAVVDALGGTGAVSDATLDAAVDAARGA